MRDIYSPTLLLLAAAAVCLAKESLWEGENFPPCLEVTDVVAGKVGQLHLAPTVFFDLYFLAPEY